MWFFFIKAKKQLANNVTYNNTLVIVDNAGNKQTFTITPWNFTFTPFLTALNAALANGANDFWGMTATFGDITNKC